MENILFSPDTAVSTREKIKTAAQQVFVARGYDGARMQEIADRAGANKAMIYYYFRSKDELFEAIIADAFRELFGTFALLWSGPLTDVREIVARMVHLHLQFLAAHPHIPTMLAREIHSGNPIVPRVMQRIFDEVGRDKFDLFAGLIQNAGRSGAIREVDTQQTIWNLIALNLFHFITGPVLSMIWPDAFDDPAALLERREHAVVDLLLHGLLPRQSSQY